MNADLKYLAVPLPEDVLKLKGYGDLDRLNRVIDRKLARDIPFALRQRLLLEKEILAMWPKSYPHNQEAALQKMRECFGADFTEQELEDLRDDDIVEWAYLNGEIHYKNNFLYNLIKTRPAYEARIVPALREKYRYKQDHARMLDDVIRRMKQDQSIRVRFRIRSTMTLDPVPGREGQQVYAHLPLPVEYAQVKNFKLLALSHPDCAVVAPPDFPQRTVCFHAEPDRPFYVEYSYENHLRYIDPDPAKAVASPDYSEYTVVRPPHIAFTPYLRMLCEEIVGEEKNPLLKARKIYDFITTKMIYSFMRPYMTMPNVPEYGASSLKGDCGVQALLFITLCRIASIPARWQAGLEVCPLDVGCHDWAMFFVAPFGWMFCDPSFGGSAFRMGDPERWNYYFGNLDPYRMPANSEYQHDFYVPFKNLRYDPYDNQDGEAEFEDATVPSDAVHTLHEALEIETI